MKKVLVTGANGLLGQYLLALLVENGYDVIAVSKGESRLPLETTEKCRYYNIDITDDPSMDAMMKKESPHTVIHAAAITQADECQLHQETCEAVNVRATAQLLLSAEAQSRHFIYVSTDFVFDGVKGDYNEDDTVNPLSWYGFTKVQAESIVETSEIPFAIVRTCLVYGKVPEGTRSNIVWWAKQHLEQGKPIRVVNDQWRTPTYAGDLAMGILMIMEKGATGVYHISGKDRLTPYDIALHTAAHCGLDAGLITAVDASSFSQPALRPPKTGFNIQKARTDLGFEPVAFEEGLRRTFDNTDALQQTIQHSTK